MNVEQNVLSAEIDLMRDVYMSRAQREAYERILARALEQPEGQTDGCHCATCTCIPGMTPAVRFDTSPAEREDAVRDHLIRMGWTPPGNQPEAQAGGVVVWRPMATAPRDGTMLRLLVRFTEHSTEDDEIAPTIGAWSADGDPDGAWQFAGWCWTHDHFTEGKGEPIGWLPLLDTTPPAKVPDIPEHVRKLVGRIDYYRLRMSYNESYFGEPEGLLKGAISELAVAVNAIYPNGNTTLYANTLAAAQQPKEGA